MKVVMTIAAITNSNEEPESSEALLGGSLPYIDYLDENYEAYALSLIEKEMENITPSKKTQKYMTSISQKFTHSKNLRLFESEYKALVDRGGNARPANEKYSPPEAAQISTGLQKDEHAWKLAVRKAKIEHELHRSTLSNLEVQQAFESHEWSKHASLMQANAEKSAQELTSQRTKVDMINAKRKDRQEKDAATLLYNLSNKYEEVVQNIQNYADANKQLKREIKKLKTGDKA